MTLETAFTIVLSQAREHLKLHPTRQATKAWELVSDYVLNEAANNPDWRA